MADGGDPKAYTGFRVQYVPEIAIRAYEYGWSDSSDPAVQAEYEALTSGDFDRVSEVFESQVGRMDDALDAVRGMPEVAFAEGYQYDTSVFGVESYDDIIRGSQAQYSAPGEEKSREQVAAGLSQTAQRIRSGQRQDGEGDLLQRGSELPDEPAFSRVRRAPFRFSEEERSVGPTGFERGTGGETEAAQGVEREESAEADLRRVAEENQRTDVVEGESLEGDGRGFTEFFATVTEGANPTYQPVAPYKPAIPLTPRVQAFKEARAQYRGNFDDHIATSIPGFDEVQSIVGQAIVETFDGQDVTMLDVGTSEGALIKAISEASGGRVSTLGVDPNPAMEDSFDSLPQSDGASFSLSAFGSAEEAGTVAAVDALDGLIFSVEILAFLEAEAVGHERCGATHGRAHHAHGIRRPAGAAGRVIGVHPEVIRRGIRLGGGRIDIGQRVNPGGNAALVVALNDHAANPVNLDEVVGIVRRMERVRREVAV